MYKKNLQFLTLLLIAFGFFSSREAQAAITYHSAGAVDYSTSGGGSVDPAFPASIAAGDLLVVIIGMKPSVANSGSVATPGGWSAASGGSLTGAGGYGTTLGADTGNTNVFAFYKVAAGGETGAQAFTLTNNNVSWGIMHRLSAGAGSTWDLSATTGSDSTGNTTVSIAMSANPGVTAADYILGSMVIPTDVTTPAQFSAEALAQTGVTFGTVTEVAEPDSQLGNDIGGFLVRAPVNAGTGSANPTLSATAGGTVTNVRGPGIFVRVREVPPVGPDATGYTNGTEPGLNFANCATTGCGARVTTGSDQTVTITGTAFGTVSAGSRATCAGGAGTGCVRIANYTIPDANVIAWSDTSIQFRIPSAVTVFGGSGTTCGSAGANGLCITAAGADDTDGALQFFVFPDITSISPSGSGEGQEGGTVTITGTRFDTTEGTVVFQNCAGSDQTGTVGAWNDTSISVTVPSGIADDDDLCDVKVTRAAATGSKTDTITGFLVLPDITSMAVCPTCASNAAREYDGAGDIDGVIQLLGSHLGTSAGSVDFSGGINLPVHGATEGSCTTGGWAGAGTSVCVEVNNTISNSTYTGTITLTRTGDSKIDTISFRILPQITSNSPTSGLVGDTVEVNGDHFCQTGTCPVSPNRSTSADNVQFGSTQAADADFQDLTGGAGTCNGAGAAWTHTEICVKVPSGTPTGSQSTGITSNTAYISNTQAFTVLSSTPNDPDVGPGTDKGQYRSNGSTIISTGSGTNETTVVFKMEMSAGVNGTFEPQVEVDPVATAFSGDNVTAGTAIAYSGTPVTGSVTVSGLTDGSSYHWRARVRNTGTSELSNWVSFGSNTENPPTNPAATDFYIDSTGPVISGVCAVDPGATSCDSSTPTDLQAQIRWSTSESGNEQVAWDTSCPTGEASAAATFSALTNKEPASPAGSGTVHSRTIGGLSGSTAYFYMVRSADGEGNVSYYPSSANTCNTFSTDANVTRIMKTNAFVIQSATSTDLTDAYPIAFDIDIPESNTSRSNITFKSIIIEISGMTVGTGGGGVTVNANTNGEGAVPYALEDPGSGTAVSWVIAHPLSTLNFDCPDCSDVGNTLDVTLAGGGASSGVSAKAIITYFYTP